MTPLMRTTGPAAGRSIRRVLGRIGVGITAVVAVVTTLVSAATVWLVLTRPLAVADAFGKKQVAEVVQALAGLMVSLLRGLVSYL